MNINEAHKRAMRDATAGIYMGVRASAIAAYLAAMEAAGFVMMPTAITQEMREHVRQNGNSAQAVALANAAYPDIIAARPRVTP